MDKHEDEAARERAELTEARRTREQGIKFAFDQLCGCGAYASAEYLEGLIGALRYWAVSIEDLTLRPMLESQARKQEAIDADSEVKP